MKFGRPRSLWGGGRGCFSGAPSVARAREWAARAWGAGCRGTEDRPCSAGARGNAGAASSRRCAASGRGCAVSGAFIGRGNEVRGIHADCLRGGVHGAALRVASSGAGCRGARDLRRRSARRRSRCGTSGGFIGRCGARCTELAPATCASSRRCGGFGARGRRFG